LGLGLALGALLGATLLDGRALTLSLISALVHLGYPQVHWVSTAELAATRRTPLLLDVREPEEFERAHLPGARQVQPERPIPRELLDLPRETPIVTYCAVGRRSAVFANSLQSAGFTAVRNLDGSIFRWANEGRPLERAGRPATRVHPYDGWWGMLLRPQHRGER